MKHIIIILFAVSSSLQSLAQNLELNAGVNHNIFYQSHRGDTPYQNFYLPYNGYQIGIGINDVPFDTLLNLRFTLNYVNYGGVFRVSDGGLGGGVDFYGSIRKSVLSLGVYLLNVKICKRIDFNLGLEVSRFVYEKIGGANSWTSSQMGSGSDPGTMYSGKISDKYHPFSSKGYVGLVARIAYPIPLKRGYSIVPQGGLYYGGLSTEFIPIGNTKSFRQFFSLGIQKSI